MSPTPILELVNVRKTYGLVAALDDISLELKKGEFLSLLGPSGSGKTTTLSLIAGLANPSNGDIRIEGRSVTSEPPYRRNIGVVFQNYALFPHMTVARNIAFPLEMRRIGAAKIVEQVRRMLALVGLEGYGERYPGQLSGGQQQRVALARAMVFNPALLLMDEPLGALDKNMREQMQLEIINLHRQHGISIVYVTHDQGEALAMSDRIAVFNNGRLEQVGVPTALYDAPDTRFVARFIGETTLLDGRVAGLADGLYRIECGPIGFSAVPTRPIETGAPVTVSIRPERIRVETGEPADHAGNCIAGTVSNVVYAGGHQRVFVDADGIRFVAIGDPKGLEGRILGVGDKVRLTWAAADARIVA